MGVALLSRRRRGSVLNERERATIAAAADTFFPPGGPIPLSGTDAGVVDYLEEYVRRCEPRQRRLMRLLFLATEYSPILVGPRRTRFTALSAAERARLVDRSSTSRHYFERVITVSMRALVTMGYFANAEVLRCIGMQFDTDPFGLGSELDDSVPAPEHSGERLKAGVVPPAELDDGQVA